MKGTATVGRPGRLDLRIRGGTASGTVEVDGASFAIVAAGDSIFVKADQRAWRELGAPAWVRRLAGRWVKLPVGQVAALEGFSLDSVAAELTSPGSPLEPNVEQAVLPGGAKVVISSQRDGSKLYVANTGPPVPIRAERKGADPGEVAFSEYGAAFEIEIPRDAVDVERAWVEAIGELHRQVDDFAGTVSEIDLTPQLLRRFAKTLGGCSRELARLGPPGDRLQPVYALVEQACGQYEQAARCFARAASLGVTLEGSSNDRTWRAAIDCGFSAPNNGSKLMADAETKAFEITRNG